MYTNMCLYIYPSMCVCLSLSIHIYVYITHQLPAVVTSCCYQLQLLPAAAADRGSRTRSASTRFSFESQRSLTFQESAAVNVRQERLRPRSGREGLCAPLTGRPPCCPAASLSGRLAARLPHHLGRLGIHLFYLCRICCK